MFGDYVFDKSSAQYTDKILIVDDEDLNEKTNYIQTFSAHGFEIVKYIDDLSFRIEYEAKIKSTGTKLAIIARSSQYIPYDIYSQLKTYIISMENLFQRLNLETIKNMDKAGLDLLCAVYPAIFDDLRQKSETETFLRTKVFSKANIKAYLEKATSNLIQKAMNISRYSDWFVIAEEKAQLDVMAVQYDINTDAQKINQLFQKFVITEFGKLSRNVDKASPVLVSKAMDYIHSHSDKFIMIIMDGMSEFDWEIISASFSSIKYEKTSMFAMIPSTTSVSRQCLLSGKYPIQLLEPWTQSKEKAEFMNCAKNLGYNDSQIAYSRGYNSYFNPFVKCGVVIINDVDDMLHSQTQGRLGMFNDITVLANQERLLNMTKRFLDEGYDVYITADHGNTLCTGLGKLVSTGVEVETRSRRTLVLKDFADKNSLIEKYNLLEYPKYYLPKEYDYLICDAGNSFDAKGYKVITHGGITLDEVVVPFIKIKAVLKNG